MTIVISSIKRKCVVRLQYETKKMTKTSYFFVKL